MGKATRYKNRERVTLSATLLRSFYLGLTKIEMKQVGKLNGKSKFAKELVKVGLDLIEKEYLNAPIIFDSSDNCEIIDFYPSQNMKKRINDLVDKHNYDKRVDLLRKLIYIGLAQKEQNDNRTLAANRLAKSAQLAK